MKKIKNLWKKQGFTLVELIIVIAIIAVLAVAAFMMLTKWLGKSRDSRKLADIETMSKSLLVRMTDLDNKTGLVPHPDDEGEQLFDGTNVFTQGVFGSGTISNMEGMQKAPKNPTTNDYYTYSRTVDGRKFQLAAEMEDGRVVTALVNNALAGDRVNALRGNFTPGIYMFDGATAGTKVVLYLPSIVAAVSTGGEIGTTQPFVLDGTDKNLIDSLEKITSYDEVLEEVAKPLAVLWSGNATDVGTESFIDTITSALSGMIEGEVTETSVEGMLSAGGIDLNNETSAEGGGQSTSSGPWTMPEDLAQLFASDSKFVQNWNSNGCNVNNITVTELTGFSGGSIPANTIYALDMASANMTENITFAGACSGIVGIHNGNTELIFQDGKRIRIFGSANHIILANLNLNNPGGFNIQTDNNTLYNLHIYNDSSGAGVYCIGGHNTLNYLNLYDNKYGVRLGGGTCKFNLVENSRIYNNDGEGIFIENGDYNIVNNDIVFNNKYGIRVEGTYNTINNSIFFNNSDDGYVSSSGDYNVINNSVFYNNGSKGITTNYSDDPIFNNVYTYNNNSNPIRSAGSNIIYYGVLGIMDGNISLDTATITSGTDGNKPISSWSVGTENTAETFDETWVVKPSISSWNYLSGGVQTVTVNGSETYTYGDNIINQVKPVKYNSSNTLVEYGISGEDYNTSKKIGQ